MVSESGIYDDAGKFPGKTFPEMWDPNMNFHREPAGLGAADTAETSKLQTNMSQNQCFDLIQLSLKFPLIHGKLTGNNTFETASRNTHPPQNTVFQHL